MRNLRGAKLIEVNLIEAKLAPLRCVAMQGPGGLQTTSRTPHRVRPCLQDGAGRHRLEAQNVASYRSGRSPEWLKMKNPSCEAVRREAEEEWGQERRR
jgi:hypothetical protein